MIELEITQSFDMIAKGHHIFLKNIVLIGRNIGDILIDDPQILDHHFRLECSQNKLYCFKNKLIDKYHVNGKVVLGDKILRPGDLVQHQRIEILIKNFKTTEYVNKQENLEKNLKKMKEDPQFRYVNQIFETLVSDVKKIDE